MGLCTISPSPSGGAQESYLGLQEAAIGGVSRAPPLPLLTLALDFWKGRQGSHRLLTQWVRAGQSLQELLIAWLRWT